MIYHSQELSISNTWVTLSASPHQEFFSNLWRIKCIQSVFCNMTVSKLPATFSFPTWFSCRKKQMSWIRKFKPRCWTCLSARWLIHISWCFDFPVKGLSGWQREIDCDISANHQGTLRRLMEILLGAEEAKVKRLVPQWERRMWEWHLVTNLLSVSQTDTGVVFWHSCSFIWWE